MFLIFRILLKARFGHGKGWSHKYFQGVYDQVLICPKFTSHVEECCYDDQTPDGYPNTYALVLLV